MDYNPLQTDAFGLSDHFSKDLIEQLQSIHKGDIHEPDLDINGSYASSLCLNLDFDYDHLDLVRTDAYQEFKVNGIEADLDEVDVYQFRLRERSSLPVSRDQQLRRVPSRKKKSKSVCVFCKNNNEQPSIFQSHVLKDPEGRVSCPILRRYVCPICGVSGDNAHTIRYCPNNTERELSLGFGMMMTSPRLATGRINPRSHSE